LWRETDSQGNTTTEYGYDAAGRLTSIKNVRTGATTLKRYDPGNRLIEEIDPLGGYTSYSYEPQTGKLLSMERGKYVTDAAGAIARDAAGNPVSITGCGQL
jgi:YD repeat-containing protein